MIRGFALGTLAGLLFWPAVCFGADLEIKGPATAKRDTLVRLSAAGDRASKDAGYIWDVSPDGADTEELPDGRLILTGRPGVYAIKLRAVDFTSKKVYTAKTTVTVEGDVPPQPIPPGPTPPTPPVPPPSPAPIPGDGLRVLIVYESGDLSRMPAAQQSILYSKGVRDYLNATCPVGADGKTREWRIWDKDADTTAAPELWRDAMKRPRVAVPWIVVSNGRDGYEGPLPATPDATLDLIRKYAK